MPALPAAPGVLKVVMPVAMASDPTALSRIFIKYTGTAPTAAQLVTFADAVSTAWNTNLASLETSQDVFGPVFVEDLSSSTGAVGTGTTTHAGTRAGVSLPDGVCVNIQFQIARRYRGGKPKIFQHFGMGADLANNGTWGSVFIGAVSTGWTAFQAAVLAAVWTGGGTLSQVNVSYFSGFTVVTNPITHRARNVPTLRGAPVIDTITGFAVEVGVASQRRRNNV